MLPRSFPGPTAGFSLLSLWLVIWVGLAMAQPGPPRALAGGEKRPFLLGGIQTNEADHQRWMAALHQAGMNAVQVTVYAHQGPWNASNLWYAEEEEAVLAEIRAARQNGLQVVLILRVALDHNEPENRFLWHGLVFPETEAALDDWFRIYTEFVLKWGRIAAEEGVEVLGIASEMSSLAATLPVDEVPGLAAYYLDDPSQLRLRALVKRSEHLFTDDLRAALGAGDFTSLDAFLVQRNRAERNWARVFSFAGHPDRLEQINRRRQKLEAHWRDLVEQVRGVYSGRLTLAANFDSYHEVGFWDALDFIGINAYFPLRETLETRLDEEGLRASWRQIFRDIETFRYTHDLPQDVLFTELGYTRWQGVTVAPWSSQGFIPIWDPDGDEANDHAFFWADQPIDPAERALALRALYRVWSEEPTPLVGILYWKLSSRLDLQRYEPFLLYLGEEAGDPAFDALTRFSRSIRRLSPPPSRGDRQSGENRYQRAVDAIVRGDLEALAGLISRGLPEVTPGDTPLLHLATRLGRKKIVERLLERGADRGARDGAGYWPLTWVCYQGALDLVALLLPPEPGPVADGRHETPLMKCARLDNVAVSRELLRLRPDQVRQTNTRGQSALHLAADQASAEMIGLLVDHGAAVDGADDSGVTPLHVAARRGDPEIVEILARRSRGVCDSAGNQPVHYAAYYGKAEVFRILYRPEAVQERNAAGQSLLHLAAHGGNLEILKILLRRNPDVDSTDKEGHTPLFLAVTKVHPEAANLLLQQGASIDRRDALGRTVLHLAAATNEPGLVRQLLPRHPDLDIGDAAGNTALHHAAGWGRLENLRLLLAAGADSGRRNREGKTPLEVAEDSGRRRAVELLRPPIR